MVSIDNMYEYPFLFRNVCQVKWNIYSFNKLKSQIKKMRNMKKSKFFVFLLILSMGGSMAFAASSNVKADAEIVAVPVTENKLMENEVNSMNTRLGEIRDMDKAEMDAKDKKEIKKELKAMQKKNRGGIYIGGATLILLIILIAVLV